MCQSCSRGDCARCSGCWHEAEHDFADWFDGCDEDRWLELAERRYDRYLDRMWGDAA